MNGCRSKNSDNNNDYSGMRPDPLVAITDKASEVDRYTASMKQVTNNLRASNKTNIATIEELEALVKYQGERLLRSIKQYGIRDPELIKKTEGMKATLVSLQGRLTKLKSMCNANKTAPINATVDKVTELVRSQIACALDAVYS